MKKSIYFYLFIILAIIAFIATLSVIFNVCLPSTQNGNTEISSELEIFNILKLNLKAIINN